MTDKSKELVTTIKLVNDRLNFTGQTDGNEPVSIDYIPPLGDNLGYTSLELFLLSLTSCVGSTVLILLRRMRKEIGKFEIQARGLRKEEHPTGFREIQIVIRLESPDIDKMDMEKAIQMSEGICPVLDMINSDVKTIIDFEIKQFQDQHLDTLA